MRNPLRRRNWKETEATVYTVGAQSEYVPRGFVQSEYLIVFSYEIDGQWYSGEYTSMSARTAGSKFMLKYDADDPSHNQYSVNSAMNTLPFKIVFYTALVALGGFIAWYMDRPAH